MSVSFFPEFHEDELFYSVVARYTRYRRAKTGRINIELFGEQRAKLSHDIPLQIRKFVETVGEDVGPGADAIVRDHTLLPYYTALRGRGSYNEFRHRMLAGDRIFREVKGSQTAVPWPARLRFCPECDEQNRTKLGTPIWLRRHQLVTSLVCLDHGGILLDSEVDTTMSRGAAYVAAADPRSDYQAVAFPWSDRAMEHYREITAFGIKMLHSQDDPNGWRPTSDLRTLAWAKGFYDGRRTMMASLINEFESYYGEALEIWPRLMTWQGRSRHWLSILLEGRSYTTDPICWALAQTFLESIPDGAGPLAPTVGKSRTLRKKPTQASAAYAAEQDPVYAQRMRAVAQVHRDRTPPTRLTRKIMLKEVHGLTSLIRIHALPLTAAVLDAEAEDHFQFVRRRLRWMFAEANSRGERISLSWLLAKRITKDRDLVREEWHRFYNDGERCPSEVSDNQ